jgi:hypothetical protein
MITEDGYPLPGIKFKAWSADYSNSICEIFPLTQGLLMPIFEPVTPEINLADVRGRAQLVLVLSKLYVLLVKMASTVPARPGRFPAFHTIQRNNNVTVEIMPNQVVKRIPEFGEFLTQHKTTFQSVKAAYKAAKEEFARAVADGRNPVLVHEMEGLSLRDDRYKAVIGPLGYSCLPVNEQV